MSWTDNWNNIIFSDEKKINLDLPDGLTFYWHDLRKKPDVRMSRNFGGGNVMIWGAFSGYGKLDLCFISNKMNSDSYVDMLETNLVPHLENVIGNRDFIFMQIMHPFMPQKKNNKLVTNNIHSNHRLAFP